MQVSGQAQVSYGYDAADRLTSITKGTDVIGFGYDNANRRTTMTLPDGISVAYGYDNDNRLTSVTYANGAATVGTLNYAYDPAGHLIAKGGTLATVSLPAAVTSATYNADNQLTLWGTQGFTYDFNGNMTSDGTKSYQWNTRNQLVALDGGSIATFQYDAFGRRRYKNVGGVDTEYAYDEDGNIAAEYNHDGGQAMSFDLSSFAPDELLCTYQDAGSQQRTFDTITDINGNVLALLSDGGIVQVSYAYEPYGQTQGTGDAGVDQQYAGRENDVTGLYFNRYRYYLPAQGRFASEDPLGLRGGPNLYSYASQDPISDRDPSGLLTWKIGCLDITGYYLSTTVSSPSDNACFDCILLNDRSEEICNSEWNCLCDLVSQEAQICFDICNPLPALCPPPPPSGGGGNPPNISGGQ